MDAERIQRETRAYTAALRELDAYVERRLAPALADKKLAPRQDALWLIYLCARSLLDAMARADRPTAFRGHAVLCRALFEHYVDFETIRRSEGDGLAGQYLDFANVQAWNHFTRVRATRRKLGVEDGTLPIDSPEAEPRVSETLSLHYPDVPLADAHRVKSWDRKDLRARAAALGADKEMHYVEFYSFQSWFAHSSPTGVARASARFLDRTALQWQMEFFSMFGEMTRALLNDLGFAEGERAEIERIDRIALDDFSGPETFAG